MTASQVSCTTSSAAWRSRTCHSATRSSAEWWRSTSVRNARSSPRRKRASSSASGSSVTAGATLHPGGAARTSVGAARIWSFIGGASWGVACIVVR